MRGYPNNPVPCTSCDSPYGAPKDGLCSRCRVKKHQPSPVKYPFRPEDDAYLRRIYSDHAHDSRRLRVAIGAFAKRLGYPRHFVVIRAGVLGIQVRQRWHWRPEEIERLRELIGVKRPLHIARTLKRSYSSVVCQIRRLEMSSRLSEGYSRQDASQVLGVTPETVQQWIRRGFLRVEQESDRIAESEMKRFLRRHPELYDLRRVDQAWFKGMIFPSFGMDEALRAEKNSASEERFSAGSVIEDREDRAMA